MVYLRSFTLPSLNSRELFINDIKRTCYTSVYPFHLFPLQELPEFTFEPITIFCGGNGCGKSTLLNVIAGKLGIAHDTAYNRSNFFEEYVNRCDYETHGSAAALRNGKIITSDDVFEYLLNIRCLNEKIDYRRDDLLDEYTHAKKAGYTFKTMEDYEELKKFVDARRSTQSRYVRNRMMQNVPEQSNGESALRYFTEAIEENALYLLDEPENSLSAVKQQELVRFLSESARFYGCQFIISTHSPFILSAPGARLYDLDAAPPRVARWTELENVRAYFDFFKEHQKAFD